MVKFLPHESVANGSFNLGHNTVLPQIKVWEDHLGNTEEVLTLLVSRLESDYAALNPKMRRPYQSKDDGLQRCCCIYVALVKAFQAKVPVAYFESELPEIRRS
ncbi:unnamed protein product, partial [Durusdinium trenchii]